MTYGLVVVTPPAVEPVSLSEAKMHLRIDDLSPDTTPDNTLISALITSSRRWCEAFQNRSYITRTMALYLDCFPDDDYIEIPKPPLQYVTQIRYLDSAGVEQTISFANPSGGYQLETDDYLVDITREPGRLYLKYGKSWPTTYGQAQDVVITFVSGYGLADSVPEEVKAAIRLKLSDLYENRGDSERTHVTNTKEDAVKALLWPERIVPV